MGLRPKATDRNFKTDVAGYERLKNTYQESATPPARSKARETKTSPGLNPMLKFHNDQPTAA